jgi:enediyne biosynthesis protein E4
MKPTKATKRFILNTDINVGGALAPAVVFHAVAGSINPVEAGCVPQTPWRVCSRNPVLAFVTACWLLLLATLPATLAQPNFTKITNSPVVLDAANGAGTAWVDYDGDGDLDLYVSANGSGENRLYRNDGHGVFSRITDVPFVHIGPYGYNASWADVDNDGLIDLFGGGLSAPSLLFRQQANGSFEQNTLATDSAYGAGWADEDNDGFLDLAVADRSPNIFWHNNRQGVLSSVQHAPIEKGQVSWVDFDGDGDMDLLVTKGTFSDASTSSHLYRNDGGGIFTSITGGRLVSLSTAVSGVAWGDYDNDRFPDVFLARGDFGASGTSFPSFLLHNNRDNTFSQVQQAPFTTDTGLANSGAWGDYDNDGWLDLFVSEGNDTVNRLYHNNGDGTFSRVLAGPIASDVGRCRGCAWGDYDRDGFLDLFVSTFVNGAPGQSYLYHNEGNTNAWITIKCVGTRSNRSAIGAKVRAKATIGGKTFWQLREINTGDGFAGNPLEAHFGLGGSTNVETLRIEWPSGTVQEFQNVDARQYLRVTEPSRLEVSMTNGLLQLSLQGGRNLQYDIQTATNLTDWSVLATLSITNLSGTALVTDTNATYSNGRFYRAVLR